MTASLLSGALGLLPLSAALACDCSLIGPVEALANAQVAFVGVATGAGAAQGAPPGPRAGAPTFFEFTVEQVLKGRLGASASVGSDASDCGVAFAAGERWRLHLFADPAGQLMTNQCAGNELMAEGAVPVTTGPAQGSGPPTSILVGLAVLAAAGGFSAWAFSRRRGESV